MRIGIFGNNLNNGYFLAQLFSDLGAPAKVLLTPGSLSQDTHDWWTSAELDEELVERLPGSVDAGAPGRLSDSAAVRDLCHRIRQFDVLLLREDGPALLSDISDMPLVFSALGADLQLLPFWMRIHYSPSALLAQFRHGLSQSMRNPASGFEWLARRALYLRSTWSYLSRVQSRQRRGIRRCSRVIVFPYQRPLCEELGIQSERIRCVPLPSTPPEVLNEVVNDVPAETARRIGAADVAFLHPARWFFIREDGNRFLKDNDKLLKAFARFVTDYNGRPLLALFEKGRIDDLRAAQRLVVDLGIEKLVIWIPELSNKALRGLFRLGNVVVCDQFSPSIPTLGNLGRECAYFGLPLITSYDGTDDTMYTKRPPHVFTGNSVSSIRGALARAAGLSVDERAALRQDCAAWYAENLDARRNATRYLEICEEAIAERRRARSA